MKRDPNLQDLSRDHHHALLLARRAERAAARGADAEVEEVWSAIAAAMDADLRTHFEVEEGLLLPSIEAVGEVELAQRVRADHARLRALCARAGDDRDGLRQFGELLRQHVRFEESELFPIAERMLGVVELEAVAEASASTAAAQERARQRAQKRIGK